MKKLNKIMSAVLVAVMVLSLVPIVSFAATTSMDGYLFVPVKTGKEAAALFQNTPGPSGYEDGADARISSDSNNTVDLEFAGFDTVPENTRTEVDVDMSSVADHPIRYISFDMTTDSLMNLCMSLEPIDTVNNDYWSKRPHSLYLSNASNGGWLTVSEHALYKTFNDDIKSWQEIFSGKWWVNDVKHTIEFEGEKKYNVVFIFDSTAMKNSENDTVSIYIDGVRRGKLATAVRLDAAFWNKLGIHHYVSTSSSQHLYLDNVEVGFCQKNHIAPTKILETDATEWDIPEGKNVFLRFTLPTSTDVAWHLKTDTLGGLNAALWYTNGFGAVIDRDVTGINSDGTTTDQSYENIKSWKNIPIWRDSEEVVVTIEVNDNFKTLEIYTNTGCKRKVYYTTRPTKVIFTSKAGNAKPTSVIAGDCVYKSLVIADSNGIKQANFAAGNERYLNTFSLTSPNRDLFTLCAYYDTRGKLIAAYDGKTKSDNDGLYAISSSCGIGGKAPENAKTMKAFIWDALTNKPVVTTIDIKNPEIMPARLLGRSEMYNGGYSVNWPSSGIEFTFEGTEAAVEVVEVAQGNDGLTDNYFNVYVDGIEQPERLILDKTGWHTIVSGLDNEKHTIKMVRSSEAKDARLWISDIKASNAQPTEEKERFIEFYGDSYAAGYGNLGVQPAGRDWGCAENSDAQRAYPYLVAECFNADLSTIAYSNKGLIWNSNTDEGLDIRELSALADVKVNSDTRNPSTWDHSKRIPDLVVIFLGTNDSGFKEGTADEFKEAYIGFIETLRERYGNDTKILCVGRHEGGYTAEVEAVANELKMSNSNIGFFRFEEFGTSSIYAHPNVEEAAASAVELNAAIAEFMGW